MEFLRLSDFRCSICDGPTQPVGRATFKIKEGQLVTAIHYCRACDVYGRDVKGTKLVDHYYVASYTDIRNEDRFLNERKGFFEYILSLAEESRGPLVGGNPVLVDFGCSYGHMLEVAQKRGYTTVGIEMNQELVRLCRGRGLNVQACLHDVPGLLMCSR
jgi:hypothetical protein